MALSAALVLVLAAQAPIMVTGGPASEHDIGYEELLAGDARGALAEIEACDTLPADDPALLVNHGIALVQLGQREEARDKFAAASRQDRLELETASGRWVDSRVLARTAIAMLDRGEDGQRFAILLR